MDEDTTSQFDTNRTNEAANHMTGMRIGENFMEVCET
jgi:hypothetical protein